MADGHNGRIPSKAELQDYMKGNGGAVFDHDVWAPVFDSDDWIQVGSSNHPPGASYMDTFNHLPEWHEAGGGPTTVAIVFAPK
jgi:hypothetical protein